MHIPDGFLSTSVSLATWGVGGLSVAASLAAERRDVHPMPAGTLGSIAAFLFAAQLVNVPVAPGTSGHLVGATLAAVMLGPWRALIVMAVVLTVQAVLFQDGGIAALGANLIDMGLAGSFVGYTLAWLVARRARDPRKYVWGAMLGAFAATLSAATLAALWLALSGLYPLGGALSFMLIAHAAIGVLEAALTGGILVTVLRWRPDLVRGLGGETVARRPAAVAVGILGLALTVAAFAAPLASSLPDGFDRTVGLLGLANRVRPMWPAPFAGYALPWGSSSALAAAGAGVLGAGVVALLAWAVSRTLTTEDAAPHH
jgi:cobalt/nickel transport system permease protein